MPGSNPADLHISISSRYHPNMDADGDLIESELLNLNEFTLDELEKIFQRPESKPFVTKLYQQVERPRLNLGGSGPPGRAD
jgi:hypothetical protein